MPENKIEKLKKYLWKLDWEHAEIYDSTIEMLAKYITRLIIEAKIQILNETIYYGEDDVDDRIEQLESELKEIT